MHLVKNLNTVLSNSESNRGLSLSCKQITNLASFAYLINIKNNFCKVNIVGLRILLRAPKHKFCKPLADR